MDSYAWEIGNKSKVQLSPSPSFLAKNQLTKEGPQAISSVVIPALKRNQDPQDTDTLLCPVRALRCYLDRTKDSRGGRQLLFISFKMGHILLGDKTEIRPASLG